MAIYNIINEKKLNTNIKEEDALQFKKEPVKTSTLGEELAALVKTDEEYARYKGYID